LNGGPRPRDASQSAIRPDGAGRTQREWIGVRRGCSGGVSSARAFRAELGERAIGFGAGDLRAIRVEGFGKRVDLCGAAARCHGAPRFRQLKWWRRPVVRDRDTDDSARYDSTRDTADTESLSGCAPNRRRVAPAQALSSLRAVRALEVL